MNVVRSFCCTLDDAADSQMLSCGTMETFSPDSPRYQALILSFLQVRQQNPKQERHDSSRLATHRYRLYFKWIPPWSSWRQRSRFSWRQVLYTRSTRYLDPAAVEAGSWLSVSLYSRVNASLEGGLFYHRRCFDANFWRCDQRSTVLSI